MNFKCCKGIKCLITLGVARVKHNYIVARDLGVVHKLQTLAIQNILTMGESRDMSRIYIALQGYAIPDFNPFFKSISLHFQISTPSDTKKPKNEKIIMFVL